MGKLTQVSQDGPRCIMLCLKRATGVGTGQFPLFYIHGQCSPHNWLLAGPCAHEESASPLPGTRVTLEQAGPLWGLKDSLPKPTRHPFLKAGLLLGSHQAASTWATLLQSLVGIPKGTECQQGRILCGLPFKPPSLQSSLSPTLCSGSP